jgi:hypothetical protein
VDLVGFEPTTFSVQGSCSSNWSYRPRVEEFLSRRHHPALSGATPPAEEEQSGPGATFCIGWRDQHRAFASPWRLLTRLHVSSCDGRNRTSDVQVISLAFSPLNYVALRQVLTPFHPKATHALSLSSSPGGSRTHTSLRTLVSKTSAAAITPLSHEIELSSLATRSTRNQYPRRESNSRLSVKSAQLNHSATEAFGVSVVSTTLADRRPGCQAPVSRSSSVPATGFEPAYSITVLTTGSKPGPIHGQDSVLRVTGGVRTRDLNLGKVARYQLRHNHKTGASTS